MGVMSREIKLLLRELRQAHELSQEELARQLGISRQSVISLERGEYLPSAPILIAMMEFFNCPIESLVIGIRMQKIDNQPEEGGEQSMQLQPWNPFQAIDQMHEEMDGVIERTLGRGDWTRAIGAVTGAMNIHEDDKQYELEIQVPGYTEKDLNIEMSEDTLQVSGRKEQKAEEKDGRRLVRREWEQSEFSRSIRFAAPIKEDKVEAKIENGTLHIVAPKAEPAKPKSKKITVKGK
jgi:HSP20 family protein